MEQVIFEQGTRMARDAAFRGSPSFWRDPFFGLIPHFVVWNLVIVVLVALIFWWLLRGSHKIEPPLDVLKKRYVSGEIDKKAYLEMKEDISE